MAMIRALLAVEAETEIGGEPVEGRAKAYSAAFLLWQVKGKTVYQDHFRLQAPLVAKNLSVVPLRHQYADPNWSVLCNFSEYGGAGLGPKGATMATSGAHKVYIGRARWADPLATYDCRCVFFNVLHEESAAEISIRLEQRIPGLSNWDALTFRVCRLNTRSVFFEELLPPDTADDRRVIVWIEGMDAKEQWVKSAEFESEPIPVDKLDSGRFDTQAKNLMQTILIPVKNFGNLPEVPIEVKFRFIGKEGASRYALTDVALI